MKHSKRRAAPKKLRAIQTSRHLHITHRQHTGHVTPHRTTSYPVLVMILLLVGILMASWTHLAGAVDYGGGNGDYTVYASVQGTAPTKAPTIDKPHNDSYATQTPITVSGRCQVETYLTLYRNGVFSGIAMCQADGTYSLETDLFVGINKLQTRIFSPTDQAGPYSNTQTVYYTPLNAALTDNDEASPLVLTSQFKYQGYYTGVSTPWDLSVNGGTAPYAIAADWGDGQRDLVSKASTGGFRLTHTYDKPGAYHGGIMVNFTATDARGAETVLRLLAIINDPPSQSTSTISGSASGSTGSGGPVGKALKYAWSGYGVAILMVASFWLGEQRELQLVAHPIRRRRA